jgi:hypothetical protein
MTLGSDVENDDGWTGIGDGETRNRVGKREGVNLPRTFDAGERTGLEGGRGFRRVGRDAAAETQFQAMRRRSVPPETMRSPRGFHGANSAHVAAAV